MSDDPAGGSAIPLTLAILGVYILLLAGATASIAEAAATCGTWPTCDGRLAVPPGDTDLLIAWGHRVIALLVGVVVLIAGVIEWRRVRRPRVRAALAVAIAGYPVQVGIGRLIAVGGPSSTLTGLHLAVGIGLFGALVLALAWRLEPAEETVTPRATDATPPTAQPAGAGSRRRSTRPTGTVGRFLATTRAYLGLMKPRLMWLLCLVAAAGMGLAAGPALTVRTVTATLLGGVLAIGASGTFNHVLERDLDRRMRRTADRPLAADRIGVRRAVGFGVGLTVAAVGVFLTVNPLAAALGLAAILYYSVVYTLVLKPNTVQNTVIGGFAGAFPALIGAAAATNRIGPAAWLLAGVIFLWTPAHFYNLALAYKEDYARGGFPMLPVVHGEATTRKHVLVYLGATLVTAALLSAVGNLGPVYAATTAVFGAGFLLAVVDQHRRPTRAGALRAFHASNAFLGAVLLAVVVDTIVL